MGEGGLDGKASRSLTERGDVLAYITAIAGQAAVPGGVLLSEETGVGKSALLDAAVAHAETAGSGYSGRPVRNVKRWSVSPVLTSCFARCGARCGS